MPHGHLLGASWDHLALQSRPGSVQDEPQNWKTSPKTRTNQGQRDQRREKTKPTKTYKKTMVFLQKSYVFVRPHRLSFFLFPFSYSGGLSVPSGAFSNVFLMFFYVWVANHCQNNEITTFSVVCMVFQKKN